MITKINHRWSPGEISRLLFLEETGTGVRNGLTDHNRKPEALVPAQTNEESYILNISAV